MEISGGQCRSAEIVPSSAGASAAGGWSRASAGGAGGFRTVHVATTAVACTARLSATRRGAAPSSIVGDGVGGGLGALVEVTEGLYGESGSSSSLTESSGSKGGGARSVLGGSRSGKRSGENDLALFERRIDHGT
jgi:hypothetical protein